MMEAEAETKRSRITWSWVAGVVVGIPFALLLAYLATLPFFLGLFFFLLVGLLTGAVMCRFGQRAIPVQPRTLWLIGADVAVFIWLLALVVEYAGFPGEAARAVSNSVPSYIITEERRAQLHDDTYLYALGQLTGGDFEGGASDHVRGFFGYLGWAVSGGTMACPRVIDNYDAPYQYVLSQGGVTWLVRVIMSLALLGFGILAPFVGLAKSPETPDDENGELESPLPH